MAAASTALCLKPACSEVYLCCRTAHANTHLAAGAMRIVVYEGQAQRRAGKTTAVVTAADLAAADVVLTTYEVLRRDIHQQAGPGAGADYAMRRRKKYEVSVCYAASGCVQLRLLCPASPLSQLCIFTTVGSARQYAL